MGELLVFVTWLRGGSERTRQRKSNGRPYLRLVYVGLPRERRAGGKTGLRHRRSPRVAVITCRRTARTSHAAPPFGARAARQPHAPLHNPCSGQRRAVR